MENKEEYNPLKSYLEGGLEDKEVFLWDEELENVIYKSVQLDAYRHNIGIRPERLKHNIREKAFHDHWLKYNKPDGYTNQGLGTLQNLFINSSFDGMNRKQIEDINNRDRMIVATVIQWLGSNCGMCFLEEVLDKFHGKIVIDWDKFKELNKENDGLQNLDK